MNVPGSTINPASVNQDDTSVNQLLKFGMSFASTHIFAYLSDIFKQISKDEGGQFAMQKDIRGYLNSWCPLFLFPAIKLRYSPRQLGYWQSFHLELGIAHNTPYVIEF